MSIEEKKGNMKILKRYCLNTLIILGVLFCSATIARSALVIREVAPVNVTPSGFSVIWQTSASAVPGISIYTDSAGLTEITDQFEVTPFPLHSGNPGIIGEYERERDRDNIRSQAESKGLMMIRVEGGQPDTIYYYRVTSERMNGEIAQWPSDTTTTLLSVTTTRENAFIVDSKQMLVTISTQEGVDNPQGWIVTAYSSDTLFSVASYVGDGAAANQAYINLNNLFGVDGLNWTPNGVVAINMEIRKGLGTGTLYDTLSVNFSDNFSVSTFYPVSIDLSASIAVTPLNPSIIHGNTQPFIATVTYQDGSTADISSSVNWSSSNTTAATIDSAGRATGIGVGISDISASLNELTGSTTLTVTNDLKSIAVSPLSPSIILGNTYPFTATGTYQDGSTANITLSVTWNSSDTTVATIDATGFAIGTGDGICGISASLNELSGTTNLTVTNNLVTIVVSPLSPSIVLGYSYPFTATGTYQDGSTQDITSSVSWSSADASVATIDAKGLATGIVSGTSYINATLTGITGTGTTLTVTDIQKIPLINGKWNLFSYSVNKCFYDTATPPVNIPVIAGCDWIKVNNIGESEPLANLTAKFDLVIGADVNGSKIYNPVLPRYNTLHYIAPGYGYWIKMNTFGGAVGTVTWLEISGLRVAPDLSMEIKKGWTLIGYWPGRTIYHSSNTCPKGDSPYTEGEQADADAKGIPLPPEADLCVKVNRIGDILSSLGADYYMMIGFDITGSRIWDPISPDFSTLDYMGPGYGYWLKMGADGVLTFPPDAK